ncbi:hypothetical protein F8M41_025477 [Gigaspora margarita]|uniref:Uncharacterized protein n=1 Tax=Gigaspora margarita TaxID=4874 RepID=A0A8H4A9U4_GIGMA|nr:hypothetical protein F8M41_025477 [Gigaspora margarita]
MLTNEHDEVFGFLISNVDFSPSAVENQYNEIKRKKLKCSDYLVDFIESAEVKGVKRNRILEKQNNI